MPDTASIPRKYWVSWWRVFRRDNQGRLFVSGDAVEDCKIYLRMRDEG